MEFVKYPKVPWSEILPDMDSRAVALVAQLVQYQSSDRLHASEVCFHTREDYHADFPGSETYILHNLTKTSSV